MRTKELIKQLNDLITSTQLGIIKRELNEPTFKDFTDPTVWSLYNHITYSLKEAHPSQYMKQHINVHKFFEEEFSLV